MCFLSSQRNRAKGLFWQRVQAESDSVKNLFLAWKVYWTHHCLLLVLGCSGRHQSLDPQAGCGNLPRVSHLRNFVVVILFCTL